AIGHDRPFYAFQATGLDRSRKSHYSIPEMATCYADLIEDTCPEGPIHLVGLCVGSYLAVEIARLLRRRGRSLSPLLLIDPLPRNPGNIRLSWLWRRWLPRRRSSDLNSIRERLRRRAAQGRSVLAVHDENAMDKAAFVTQDFTDALQAFRARPFDGPVILMLSQERADMIKSRRSTIRRCLRNVQATHVVADKHKDVLAEERESLFPVLHEVVNSLDLAQQIKECS
ncbi:MAG: alpha/beta fold hydrolase, partial [Cyanobacteriota bacterium]|nr:alpha/beta fold hydrolase [Cyanobacteriota bacterium]